MPRTPGTPRTPKTTPPSRVLRGSPAAGGSCDHQMVLRGSPFRSPSSSIMVETPTKHLKSPLKGILRTPIKDLGSGPSSSGIHHLCSPASRTPKKSVTWSPCHQRDATSAGGVAFKVPQTSQRLKAACSPVESPEEPSSWQALSPQSVEPSQHSTSPEPRSPCAPHHMNTRSGRSPGRSRASPWKPKGAAASTVSSPAKSLMRKRRSTQEVGTRNVSRVPSAESLNCPGSCPTEDLSEHSQTSEGDSGSSQLNSVSTGDDSLDIVEAAVTKTQFSGGLKMNISFSRKNSQSEDLVSPKPRASSRSTPGRTYGFRQTPDRQQREAAARLGYGNEPPRFSTPRAAAGPRHQKETGTRNLLTYQVEMEMQTCGVPKLKIKRTDSMNAADSGAPAVAFRLSQLESPKALVSKPREPGCVSPSVCPHVTPAKSTPGKGLQTFICQSYSPACHPGGTAPPVAVADIIALTPSPQSVGKPPDNLNSWPRKKRAQPVGGGKDRSGLRPEGGQVDSVDEGELGVRRLQDLEDLNPADSTAQAAPSPLEDFYWMDRLAHQDECTNPQRVDGQVVHESRACK